jgi:arsenite methyltransferase
LLSAEKQRLVDVLERRGADPNFASFRESYLDAMDLPVSASVLDMGSGSGVVARSLASRPWFSGSILGIELDPELVRVATEQAAREGLSDRVRFEVGNAEKLELPDRSVDGVTAQTSISHVHDPMSAMREISRVMKPGGKLAVCDGDYEARSFGCSDHELARTMEDAFRKLGGHQPRLMRDMPELLHSVRFALEQTIPFVDVQAGDGGKWLETAERFAPQLAESGDVTAQQVERWLDELRSAAARGTFFAAGAYYAFIARRVDL